MVLNTGIYRYIICLLILCSSASQANDVLVPREYFTSLPKVSSVEVSPDGKHVASIMPINGIKHIVVGQFGSSEIAPVFNIEEEHHTSINWLLWANNERILFSYSYPTARYGVKFTERRLGAVNLDGSNLLFLVDPKRNRRLTHNGQFKDQVVSTLKYDNKHILLQYDGEEAAVPDVYRVNIYTDKMKRIVINGKKEVIEWMADRKGEVRLGISFVGFKKKIFYRKNSKSPWEQLTNFDVFEENSFSILSFDKTGNHLYVLSDRDTGREGIWTFNTQTMDFEKLVYAHEFYDTQSIIYSEVKDRVVGARYIDHTLREVFFDKEESDFRELLNRALPDRNNIIISESDDEGRFVLYSSRKGQPPEYFIGQRTPRTLALYGHSYPQLDKFELAETEAVSYKARDGYNIPAYLTLPVTVDTQDKKPPLIVMPHGGPSSRDTLDFDPLVQFLASRGYAVLQPNFRGSTGYGTMHERAGYRQWGLLMQDDITDGVEWLKSKKIIDPKRICIVGASYGGYAALAGASLTPDLYRCAVSFAGISDLQLLLKEERKYRFSDFNRPIVGDSWSDRDQLKEKSPIRLIDKIKSPILLLHGKEDRVVAVEQSEKMAKALEEGKKKYKLVLLDGGNHYMSNPENRDRIYSELEAFLSQHL